MTQRVKIILLAVAVTIAIGLLFITAKRALGNGQLNITTTDPASYITLARITPNPATIDTKSAQGKYSAQLPEGTYTITAQNKSYSTQQIVTVKAGQTVSANVDLVKAGPLEAVLALDVTNLVTDGTVLRYIDRDSNALYEINKLNQLRSVGNPLPYTSILWASPSFGIARNAAGHFSSIQGAAVASMAIPFSPSNLTTSYAVAPNKDVYVTDGTKLYRGASGQNFQLIFTSAQQVTIKAASAADVLIQESNPAGTKTAASLVAINHSGATARTEGEAYDAAFSPSGARVVINGPQRSAVLDVQLHEFIRLPQNNVTPPVWVNDSTLVYAQQNKLWQFNATNGQADMIADTTIAAITQQFVSADGAYVYMATQNISDGANPMLQRVGLKHQPVAQAVTILGLILPTTVDACRLTFVNFTAPTVAIQGPKGSQAICTQKAQQYLQTYHVSTNAVGLSFSGN